MSFRAGIRGLIPLILRQEIKQYGRYLIDFTRGFSFGYSISTFTSNQPVRIVQPIMPSAFYENKVINITRGAYLLHQNLIPPNQYWSFWYRVSRPSASNGFAVGRNLVNDALVAQTGGGLCQISSMIYHLALLTGLTVIERHPHSVDIYEENQRFTPLGADATVVWGYKDLRLYNPHPFAVSFQFAVKNGQLIGEVHSEPELKPVLVEFIRLPLEKTLIKVNVVVNGLIQSSGLYKQKPV